MKLCTKMSTSLDGCSNGCYLWWSMFSIIPGSAPTHTPFLLVIKNALSAKFSTKLCGSKGKLSLWTKSVFVCEIYSKFCTQSWWTRKTLAICGCFCRKASRLTMTRKAFVVDAPWRIKGFPTFCYCSFVETKKTASLKVFRNRINWSELTKGLLVLD